MEAKLIEIVLINMKSFKKYIFLGIILLVLNSCGFLESKDYLIVNSAWFMDSIKYDGENVKHLFIGNALIFEEDKCSVPLKQIGMDKGDDVAKWHIDEDNHLLVIQSKNEYFNGTFEFCFKEHKKDNVIELYMESDSVTILAHSPNKMESKLLNPPFFCSVE